MRCIVCGGDHQPAPLVCDPAGMDREIKRMGARRWNRITARVRDASIFSQPYDVIGAAGARAFGRPAPV
jgi:hypothetical protein